MAASVPEQLGEDRPNRQLTNPQDDERGAIDPEGKFTGRWADSHPREKTSVSGLTDEDRKELDKARKEARKEAERRDAGR